MTLETPFSFEFPMASITFNPTVATFKFLRCNFRYLALDKICVPNGWDQTTALPDMLYARAFSYLRKDYLF